jgi:hypothetical protein
MFHQLFLTYEQQQEWVVESADILLESSETPEWFSDFYELCPGEEIYWIVAKQKNPERSLLETPLVQKPGEYDTHLHKNLLPESNNQELFFVD